jgi:hypothetical protein
VVDLDVIASSLAQDKAGRTIHIDIPSQHGLFPHLLAPLLGILPAQLKGLTIALLFCRLTILPSWCIFCKCLFVPFGLYSGFRLNV